MDLSNENLREKNFHNKLQTRSKGRFENIFYKSLYNLNSDFFNYIKFNCANREILDYGCGIGKTAQEIEKYNPKKITGIDISEVSIEKARKRAKNFKTISDFSVDNCENSKFKDEQFDLVYGTGILHHLDIKKSLKEIHRILKVNGNMIFVEPLGTNPFINFYRKLTPNSRSEDEHPFVEEDFQLIKDNYKELQIKYYGFFTLCFFPFYRNPEKSKFFKLLCAIDQVFFKIMYFRFLAWSVLIIAKKN